MNAINGLTFPEEIIQSKSYKEVFLKIHEIIKNTIDDNPKFKKTNDFFRDYLIQIDTPVILKLSCGSGKSWIMLLWTYYIVKFTDLKIIILIDDYEFGFNNIIETNEDLIQMNFINEKIDFLTYTGKSNMCDLPFSKDPKEFKHQKMIKELMNSGHISSTYCKNICKNDECEFSRFKKRFFEEDFDVLLITNRQINYMLDAFILKKSLGYKYIMFFDETLEKSVKTYYKWNKPKIKDNIDALEYILNNNIYAKDTSFNNDVKYVINETINLLKEILKNFRHDKIDYEDTISYIKYLEVMYDDNIYRNIATTIFTEISNKKYKKFTSILMEIDNIIKMYRYSQVINTYGDIIFEYIFSYKRKYFSILFVNDFILKQYFDSSNTYGILNLDGTANDKLTQFYFQNENTFFIENEDKLDNSYRLNYNASKMTLTNKDSIFLYINDSIAFCKYVSEKLNKPVKVIINTRKIKANNFNNLMFEIDKKNVRTNPLKIQKYLGLSNEEILTKEMDIPEIKKVKILNYPVAATSRYKDYDCCISFNPFFPKSTFERECKINGMKFDEYKRYIESSRLIQGRDRIRRGDLKNKYYLSFSKHSLNKYEKVFKSHDGLCSYFLRKGKLYDRMIMDIKKIKTNLDEWFTYKDCVKLFEISYRSVVNKLKKMVHYDLLILDDSKQRNHKFKVL